MNSLRHFWKFSALLGFFALSAAQADAAEVEAKKSGVEVYADATNKSEVVGKLKEGDSLVAGERKGMFWQVTTKDGKKGFVSVLAVKHKAEANSDLAKAIKGVVKEGRTESSGNETRARSAVMGVRGLRADDNMANAANIRPNLRAVYQMEDTRMNEKRVQTLGDEVFNEIAEKADPK